MRQRGTILVGVLLVSVGLVVVGIAASMVYHAGYSSGEAETTAKYLARDNKALREVAEARDKAVRQVRALEDENARLVTAASRQYQKGLNDGKVKLDAALAAVRAGERLRDPGRTGAPECAPDPAAAPGASAAGHHGPARGELSDAASDFLLRLAAEADDVVRQLTACQAVIEADRK